MTMLMKKAIVGSTLLLAAASASARQPLALDVALKGGGTVTLPITIRSGFAFVTGEANGQKGLLMLDTGTPFPLFLNNAFVRLPLGKEEARGSASSGQRIVVLRYSCLRQLRIAGKYTLPSLCDHRGADLAFAGKELNVPLLGFIGNGLIGTNRITFDWVKRRATISDRRRPVEPGAIASLPFAPQDRQVPKITVTAAHLSMPASMDTGDPGHVELTRADADKLLASGTLIAAVQKDGRLGYTLPSVEHDGRVLNTSDLPVTIAADRSTVMLGFLFLKHYRTTWDYGESVVRVYTADL